MDRDRKYKFGNVDPTNPSLTIPYSWESFDFIYWRQWMSQNFHLAVMIVFTYIVLVFLGQFWMKSRQPKKLKGILVLWNLGFALFSLLAFVRTFPDLLNALKKQNGFYHSVCSSEGQSYPYAWWSFIGIFSKVAELGDTGFLISRKHKVIFLHWFHHGITLLYTWYVFEAQEPCHRWLMTMNFFIHILMYFYFSVRAGGIMVSKKLAMVLTFLQLSQMGMGVYINWYTWRALVNGIPCHRSEHNLKLAFIMYLSYLILFLNLFYNSYLKRSKSKSD